MFKITTDPIVQTTEPERSDGARVVFDGIVRDHDAGQGVTLLEYEAMPRVAEKEGEKIISEAKRFFEVSDVTCVHRTGTLQIGDVAVRVTATSAHRQAAFDACKYVIDEVKKRVPIWKKQTLTDGATEWVNATTGQPVQEHSPAVFVDCGSSLEQWTIVDIRETDEQEEDPIEGFQHVSAPMSAFSPADLERCERKPLLVCATGIRGLILADELWREGNTRVHALTGGVVTLKHIARKRKK